MAFSQRVYLTKTDCILGKKMDQLFCVGTLYRRKMKLIVHDYRDLLPPMYILRGDDFLDVYENPTMSEYNQIAASYQLRSSMSIYWQCRQAVLDQYAPELKFDVLDDDDFYPRVFYFEVRDAEIGFLTLHVCEMPVFYPDDDVEILKSVDLFLAR